jgi:hypothetical protein
MASRDARAAAAVRASTDSKGQAEASIGKRIEPWVKRRTSAEKALLLIVVFALLGMYWFFELRDLWRWVS